MANIVTDSKGSKSKTRPSRFSSKYIEELKNHHRMLGPILTGKLKNKNKKICKEKIRVD
jgi:hypothetical protein